MRRLFPKLLFLVSLLLLGATYAVQRYDLITLRSIDISGTDRISSADLPLCIGDNVFTIPLHRVLGAILAHDFVEAARVKVDYEGNLLIGIREKAPVAYLYLDRLYGVTACCELIPANLTDTVLSLPVIRGLQLGQPRVFERIDDACLRGSLKMLGVMRDAFPRSFATLSEVWASREGLRLVFEPGSVVVNLGWGEYEKKLQHLESILTSNKNPGLNIDLRFVDISILKTRTANTSEASNGI